MTRTTRILIFALIAMACFAVAIIGTLAYSANGSWQFIYRGRPCELALSDGWVRLDNRPQISEEKRRSVDLDRQVNELLDEFDQVGGEPEYRAVQQSFYIISLTRPVRTSNLSTDPVADQQRILQELKSLGYSPSLVPVVPVIMSYYPSLGRHSRDVKRAPPPAGKNANTGQLFHTKGLVQRLSPQLEHQAYEFWRPSVHVPFIATIEVKYQFPISVLFLPPACLIGIGIRRIAIRRARVRTGHCIHCGYDLRVNSGRCPECGQFTALTPSTTMARGLLIGRDGWISGALSPFALRNFRPFPSVTYFCGMLVIAHCFIEFFRALSAVFSENLIHDSWSYRLILCVLELAIGLVTLFGACQLAILIEDRHERRPRCIREEQSASAHDDGASLHQ
ncbi:MAG TPA: hypothetical protein VFE47_30470 [Tepidisphaeraceae bacterium]|nr:hypothetical protein [Tepidisphaeraceae bacterium]